MSMKIFSDTICKWTYDLPAFSTVYPTALLRAPIVQGTSWIFYYATFEGSLLHHIAPCL